jgi:hypothetical protein
MPSKSRQLLGLVLLAVFSLPFNVSAYASATYTEGKFFTVTTTGDYQDTTDGIGCDGNYPSGGWIIRVWNTDITEFFSRGFDRTEKSGTAKIDFTGDFMGADVGCIVDMNTIGYNGGSNNPLLGGFSLVEGFMLMQPTEANNLIASVSTAVQSTGFNIWPIVATVVGLILAFYGIKQVIRLFRK